jgi:hypothetical protein
MTVPSEPHWAELELASNVGSDLVHAAAKVERVGWYIVELAVDDILAGLQRVHRGDGGAGPVGIRLGNAKRLGKIVLQPVDHSAPNASRTRLGR